MVTETIVVTRSEHDRLAQIGSPANLRHGLARVMHTTKEHSGEDEPVGSSEVLGGVLARLAGIFGEIKAGPKHATKTRNPLVESLLGDDVYKPWLCAMPQKSFVQRAVERVLLQSCRQAILEANMLVANRWA